MVFMLQNKSPVDAFLYLASTGDQISLAVTHAFS